MRLRFKMLFAPVIALLTLFVWICSGLLYCSAFVFGIAGTIVALLGVAAGQNTGFAVRYTGSDLWVRMRKQPARRTEQAAFLWDDRDSGVFSKRPRSGFLL